MVHWNTSQTELLIQSDVISPADMTYDQDGVDIVPTSAFPDLDLIPETGKSIQNISDFEIIDDIDEQPEPEPKKVKSRNKESTRQNTKSKPANRRKRAVYERVDGKVVCPHCSKRLTSSNGMAAHIRTHQKEKPYSCKNCANKYSSKMSLKRHNACIHLGQKFACSQCDRTFYNQTRLRDHMNMHTGDKPYQCHMCETKFKSQEKLRKHIDLHLNKFCCNICDKTFASKKQLKPHMKLHEKGVEMKRRKPRSDRCGEHITIYDENYEKKIVKKLKAKKVNKDAQFICDECENVYESEEDLIQHLMEHTESDAAKDNQEETAQGCPEETVQKGLEENNVDNIGDHSETPD